MIDISKLKLGDIVRFKTNNNAFVTAIFNFAFHDNHTKCEIINFCFVDYEDYGYMKCALDDAVWREFHVSSILNIELATAFEIKKFYDKIIAQYEKEETDLYKYFTDSTYFELKDWLIHKCQLFVDYNFKYPSFIDDFAHYAWDVLCKKADDFAGVAQPSNNQSSTTKMVSLDKVKEWLNKNLTTEYLYAHENDDYPISYVRVMGKNQTVYDVVEAFCKAMEE